MSPHTKPEKQLDVSFRGFRESSGGAVTVFDVLSKAQRDLDTMVLIANL
jgi:hypothetical protein